MKKRSIRPCFNTKTCRLWHNDVRGICLTHFSTSWVSCKLLRNKFFLFLLVVCKKKNFFWSVLGQGEEDDHSEGSETRVPSLGWGHLGMSHQQRPQEAGQLGSGKRGYINTTKFRHPTVQLRLNGAQKLTILETVSALIIMQLVCFAFDDPMDLYQHSTASYTFWSIFNILLTYELPFSLNVHFD